MKLTSMYSNFLRSSSNLTDLSTSPPKADAKETNPTQPLLLLLLLREERRNLGAYSLSKLKLFLIVCILKGATQFLLSPEIEEDFALSSKSQSASISIHRKASDRHLKAL
ncbi:unnamed protein product [Citrullus colocynthis]|uniref:Uncharacterized protein n=1 Tax=Citrullus colocynthis TaxID=252529 RepID=A0ABP0YXW3_9ROSI